MAFFKVGPTLKQIFMLPKMFSIFFPFLLTGRPVSAAATTPAHSQPPPSSCADHKTFKRIKVGIFSFGRAAMKELVKSALYMRIFNFIAASEILRLIGPYGRRSNAR